jgi:membrane protease subunit HflC
MRFGAKLLIASLVLAFILLNSIFFVVKQGQSAIILRLGRLVDDPKTHKLEVFKPGLHSRIPLIDQVRPFDTRLQTLDIKSSRIVTKEKKDVMVDYYVKWRIKDLSQYFLATGGNSFKAEALLEQQLNTSLRAQFGKRLIAEVVSGGREDIMEILRQKAEAQVASLGIEVVDVRIKGIDLPESTSAAIYQRMRADMQKIANRHRADGQAGAEAIRAEADAKVTVILAQANKDAAVTRAAGQAKAASLYAETYAQNPKFFSLYRRLKAYQKMFKNKGNTLVVDTQNDFFDLMRQGVNPSNSLKSK